MEQPPVQDAEPGGNVLKVVNPLMGVLLRSPLHRLLDKDLMLVKVTGRNTGRVYTIPVGRHEADDGSFVLMAGGRWRHNLRGGAEVRVHVDGREHAAHATLEEDPDRAAEALKKIFDQGGARALAVKVNVDRPLTVDEMRPLLASRAIAYVKLTD
jgi:F420H(2)-dependent quinone reductase